MLKRYHHLVGGTFRVIDALIISFIWVTAYFLRFYLPVFEVTKGFPEFSSYAALLPVIIPIWLIIFSSFELYKPKRMLRRTQEAQRVLKAHSVSLLFFISLTYLFSEYKYSRGVILYFGFIGAILLVFSRVLFRNFLRSLRKSGFSQRNLLLVGEGPALESVIYRLERFPELGFKVCGALTEDPKKTPHVFHKPTLGSFEELSLVLKNHKIDEVLIALPRSQSIKLDEILSSIKDETVDIRILPDVYDYITLGCEVEDFDGLPLVNLNESPLDGFGAILKRSTDLILTVGALIFLSPLLLLISLLIKFTSKGPIIYSQIRMGLDGKTFSIYKFRTMHMDAENKTGAVWAQPNDQRKTKLGSFLRSTSMDELPQLWNVLKGEMSLVGPRPERPVFVEKFKGEIPHYMLRHKVKAGLTGWAQINGWRGNTSLDKRIEFDLYYIRNWSYLLDIKIIFLTLWKGFIHKNAY